MCIVFFSYKSHPRYFLIAAFNRDEYLDRETLAAHFWDETPILAGKDAVRGGTWFGMTTTGRYSWLTNFRSGSRPISGQKSRGALVTNYLLSNTSPSVYFEDINKEAQLYGGSNVVAGDTKQLCYYSTITQEIHELSPGIYGLSNHLLDTSWPKLVYGKQAFTKAIQSEDERQIRDQLLHLMQNKRRASIFKLPKTGVSKYFEWYFSSIFVHMRGYGTRTTTLLFITHDGTANYYEYTHQDKDTQLLEFSIKL
ncbi:NRDE family protein [Candidatus Uabimicrobium amorphum]|uniref:NRDE family protein n=1 Tax=Uabimicrobium amorphum TaxID=2596890 RepID=A0A5S9IQ76_UABAM|nr:NRDE family protein [Candidatus Uabimicrobium amorphum]BBM85140.1 hypothetical protein UABAM_03503 [Candidatus Uabimicrobium amorphum]